MISPARLPVSVDLFCGGGGTSIGIERAFGRSPIIAINHCEHAIRMHARNHPSTIHLQCDVHDVRPAAVMDGRPLDHLHLSPDCTSHSRARGGKPRRKEFRDLAWVALPWARLVRPTLITLENVPEFLKWGPLDEQGQPSPEREGETFREFVGALEAEGYVVEWRTLAACDYGTPTTRSRLYLVARRDGQTIVWPEPTHGPGRPLLWRTAAECIDFSLPCPSIFLSTEEARELHRETGIQCKRPLADNTMRRIAAGLVKFVLEEPEPFLVVMRGTSPDHVRASAKSLRDPLPTVAAQGVHHRLAAPYMVQTGYGERPGQRPRYLDMHKPLGTVVATGNKHALVAAWLAKHNGKTTGQDLRGPVHAVTSKDTKRLVEARLEHLGPDVADRARIVAAFLVAYYGSEKDGQALDEPLRTIVAKARFGLVTVEIEGAEYAIVDIGMRMLEPRELARAQGWPEDYVLTGTKSQQIHRIGNGVCPEPIEAILRANFASVSFPAAQPDLWPAAS